MSVFERIAKWATDWTGGKESTKDALISQINDTRMTLESLSTMLRNSLVVDGFVAGLDIRSSHQTARYLTGAAYHAYLRGAPTKAEQMEHRHPLSSITMLIDTGIMDLNELARHTELFSAPADDEAPKLSLLVCAGYVQSLSDLAEWVYYLFRLSDEYRPDGSKSGNWFKMPAPYVRHKVEDLIGPVVALCEEIMRRKGRETFVSLVEKMNATGRNLKVSSDGHSIADYASERTYESAELNYSQLGLFNPFAMWGTSMVLRRRAVHQRNVAIRDWLAAKTARYALDAAQTDPEGPEYARLIKISQNYSDLVAQYDREIEKNAHKY